MLRKVITQRAMPKLHFDDKSADSPFFFSSMVWQALLKGF